MNLDLKINENGLVSFNASFAEYQPRPLPIPISFGVPPFVAPYWADFDLNCKGSLFYRFETSGSGLDYANNVITTHYKIGQSFAGKMALIATWENVTFSDGGDASPVIPQLFAVLIRPCE